MSKTTSALKLAEEAFNYRCTPMSNYSVQTSIDKEKKALAAIREALAEPEITTPDVCGEVCARAKLCYGCGKAFDEALADHIADAGKVIAEPVKQEPVATEHPLVAYAESYEQIARSGSYGKVFALAVATDIRQNMIPLTAANVDLSVLRPRNWTREMSDAWHRAIPNLEKAFDDLIAAYKEKNK